jgi:hypothetical protein
MDSDEQDQRTADDARAIDLTPALHTSSSSVMPVDEVDDTGVALGVDDAQSSDHPRLPAAPPPD